MKKLYLLVILLFLLSVVQSAQAQRTSLLDDEIVFALPQGFEEISKDQVNFKFILHNPAKIGCCLDERIFAYQNKSKNIAVDLSFISPDKFGERYDRDGVQQNNLVQIKTIVEAMANKNTQDLKWLTKENIVKNKQKWIHLVFQTAQNGENKIYEQYLTDYQANLMVFSVNLPANQYEKEKADIAAIAKSLKASPALLEAPVTNALPRTSPKQQKKNVKRKH